MEKDTFSTTIKSNLSMASEEEIQRAIENTEVILAPEQTIETFGTTIVDYHVLSAVPEQAGKTRIREGRVHAERPRIITPTYYANELLENFGEDAQEYAEWLKETAEGVRILQYGLRFRKEEATERYAYGDPPEVAEQVAEEVKAEENKLNGVILGLDEFWEVSLLKFTSEMVQRSASSNIQELHRSGMLQGSSGDVPYGVRAEIESEFRYAEGNRTRIEALGKKLQKYGLFEEYEDRFFRLFKRISS